MQKLVSTIAAGLFAVALMVAPVAAANAATSKAATATTSTSSWHCAPKLLGYIAGRPVYGQVECKLLTKRPLYFQSATVKAAPAKVAFHF